MVLIFVISSEHCTEVIDASERNVGHFTSYLVFCDVDYNCTEWFAALVG